MAAPIKLNLKVYQGSTFKQVLRWESSTKAYIPITNIPKAAPTTLEVPGHGVPRGWRARVTGNIGMKELVALDYQTVTETTTNTVTFNQVNSLGFSTYTSGGVLEYNLPVPLDNLTARMQLRAKLDSPILYELTTTNGGIVFDTQYYTITLNIPDSATMGFDFAKALYLLEFENTLTGETIPFAKGTVSVEFEVTK